jgi:purine-binding chemotaxis protein CheW
VCPGTRADSPLVSGVFVQLRIGAERYALAVEHVLEVTTFSPPTPLPGTRPDLLGLVALRGRVLPVYEAAGLLGVPDEPRPTRIVVVADGALRAGVAVDEVLAVGPLPDTAPADEPLLSGMALHEGRAVGVVDARVLLAELAR